MAIESNQSEENDRPLRVLCCSGSLEGGGSERQLWQLASKLDRQCFEPSVYLLYRQGHYISQLPSDVTVDAFWDFFNEQERYWPGQIRRLQIGHLASVIRERKIDVVYDRTFHMTLVTSAACKRANVRRVSVIVSPPSADFQKSRERFRFIKKWILAAAYRESGCVTIAVSEEVADDAARFYGLNRPQIRVLPNPVDIAAVRSAANESKTTSDAVGKDHGVRIAVVGRLSCERGQRLALQALKLSKLQNANAMHLDIVGDGPDRAQLERLASELGIREHVTFHGFVANPYPLIRNTHMLCIPSEHEGLPNVALEAMALGTAVVATNCSGSLRTLIGNNERGVLVSPGNAEQLAAEFIRAGNLNDDSKSRTDLAMGWVERNHAIAPWLAAMATLLRTK